MKSRKKPRESLEGLAKRENGAQITELGKQRNSPKTTIYQVLSTAKSAKFPGQDREDKETITERNLQYSVRATG